MQRTLELLIIQANAAGFDLSHLLNLVRRQAILSAYERSQGNHVKAAAILKRHRNSLYRDMEELGLRRGRINYRKRIVVQAGEPWPTI